MSKPSFSRKRKGKKVDAYPLGTKVKGKSTQTKGQRGRPRKPVEANILVANQIGKVAGMIDQYMVDEKGYETAAVNQLKAIEKNARAGMTEGEAKAAISLLSQIRESIYWHAYEGAMISSDRANAILEGFSDARDGLREMNYKRGPLLGRKKSIKVSENLERLIMKYDDVGYQTDAKYKLQAIQASLKDGLTSDEAKISARVVDQMQETHYWEAIEGGSMPHDDAENFNDLLLETSDELEKLAKE